MEDAKDMKTPMHPTTCLGLDEKSNKVDNSQYKAMIGSLLYLIASRPNILFGVGLCARFEQDPREVHLTSLKRIFRYLNGTPNLGLYFKYSKEFRLISYCDADYACEKIERRSTSESYHIIGGNLVTWINQKQGLVTLFTAKAEYISVASCCTQLIWIKNQLEDYSIYGKKSLSTVIINLP